MPNSANGTAAAAACATTGTIPEAIGYAVRSIVRHGYGRGSRELGTPTGAYAATLLDKTTKICLAVVHDKPAQWQERIVTIVNSSVHRLG